VVARRWQVAAHASSVDVARADFYPNINLVASLGFGAVGGGLLSLFQAGKLGGAIGPALSLPLFDGGRRRGRLGAASAAYDAAVARYNRTLITALREIADQLIRLHSLDEQQRLAAEAVATSETSWRIAEQAWHGGLTDYLAVLEAQTRLFAQQRVQQQVWAARLAAHAELMAALGGGLLDAQHAPAERLLEPRRVPVASAGAARQ
jgi:outer membrane protein TolC